MVVLALIPRFIVSDDTGMDGSERLLKHVHRLCCRERIGAAGILAGWNHVVIVRFEHVYVSGEKSSRCIRINNSNDCQEMGLRWTEKTLSCTITM